MSDEPQEEPMEIGDNMGAILEKAILDIEALEEEKAAIAEDIKSIKSKFAADGGDKKELGQILKDRKADLEKTVEFRTRVELLRRALANRQGELGDWARQYRSRAAKYRLDQTSTDQADTKLDEFMKNRKSSAGNDDGEARP